MDGKPSGETRRRPVQEADESRPSFTVRTPNATTVKAMKDLEEGGGKRFASVEKLFEEMGIRLNRGTNRENHTSLDAHVPLIATGYEARFN